MSITNGYATLEQFADHLKDDRISDDDPKVERIIEAASRAIDSWTGRRFWLDDSASARLFHAGYGNVLEVGDFIALTSVTPEASFGVLGTAYATDTYRAGPYDNLTVGWPYRWIEGSFTGWGRTVSVVARWGWPEVPAAVTEACLLKAARIYKRRETVTAVVGFDEFAVRIGTSDPDVTDLLTPYRLAPYCG